MPVDAAEQSERERERGPAGVHVRLECSISNLDRGAREHTRGYEFSQDVARNLY